MSFRPSKVNVKDHSSTARGNGQFVINLIWDHNAMRKHSNDMELNNHNSDDNLQNKMGDCQGNRGEK